MDPEQAYIISSKALAMTAVDLLCDEAEKASGILASFEPALDREEYLQTLRQFAESRTHRF